MENKKRLQYIDCLRGFSMIFVIYQHILTYSMPDLPASWFSDLVRSFRMPLFFFISGFVSYKLAFEWNFSNFGKLQMKKLRGQLFPTIVMFVIFVALHDKSYNMWMFSVTKAGYWFTLVSFEIFLTYCIINLLMRRWQTKTIVPIIFILTAIGISCIWYRLGKFEDNKLSLFLSLEYYTQYFLYFIAGILVKCYLDTFHKLVENKWTTTVMFVGAFVLPYMFPSFFKTVKELMILPRLWCIYAIFYNARQFFDEQNIVSKSLSLIGRNTLEIYFLHYFLLFRMSHCESLLKLCSGKLNWFMTSSEWLLEILIVGGVSVFLCFVCVGIKRIVDTFPIVSELCFGPQKNVK
ncbi:MAG: acyltransferase [Bacteroidales bacterium]|nr:acyltransferase [Bacteroidales bacterium]